MTAMTAMVPKDPDFEARVRASFDRQALMATLGARLAEVLPGRVVATLDFDPRLGQQHGFLHAGALTSVLDSTCGYAALSLMPPGAGVLSIEFKVNLLAPARAPSFRVEAAVLKPGRTIVFVEGRAYGLETAGATLVATMTATMMAVRGRDGVAD